MPALLVRAHETDTNAWYPVAPSHSPGPALSVTPAVRDWTRDSDYVTRDYDHGPVMMKAGQDPR